MKPSNPDLAVRLDDTWVDFSRYAVVPRIAKLCITYVKANRSRGETTEARQRTNRTLGARLHVFLKFAAENGIDHVNEDVCRRFIEHLRTRYAPNSQWNNYKAFTNAVAYGVETKVIEDFLVPRGISKTQAQSTTGQIKTLADDYIGEEATNQDDANRKLLICLNAFCWHRIHQIRDRQKQGYLWRDEVADDDRSIDLRVSARSRTRSDHLRRIVRYYWRYSQGYTGRLAGKETRHATRTEVTNYMQLHSLDIRWTEIHDYLRVTPHLQGPFMCLMAMERLNSDMIMSLRAGMLRDNPLNPDTKQIVIVKGRAKSEKTFGPYKVGRDNAKTIPQLWRIQEEIQRRTFNIQEGDESMRMLRVFSTARTGVIEFAMTAAVTALKGLQATIMEDETPEFALLRRYNGRLNLKIIRNTVINVDRRSNSFPATVRAARHKSGSTTAIYLRNPAMRAAYEREVEQGQSHLEHLVRSATLIHPDEQPADVAANEHISLETAKELVSDELNLGYGFSLFRDRTFVICTALNYLRIERWAELINRAEPRIMRDNPDRWERVWAPQLAVLKQALADFPRKLVRQAMLIRDTIDLKYPEPY